MKMKWVPDYNTGIDVIDDQHKRILDYINEIDGVDANTEILLIIPSRILPLKNHFRKKRVINIVCHINVCMTYLLKRLNLIVTVLNWANLLKRNYMKYYLNG